MRGFTVAQARAVLDALVSEPGRPLPVGGRGDLTAHDCVNAAPGSRAVAVLREMLGTGDDLTVPVAVAQLAVDCATLETAYRERRNKLFTTADAGLAVEDPGTPSDRLSRVARRPGDSTEALFPGLGRGLPVDSYLLLRPWEKWPPRGRQNRDDTLLRRLMTWLVTGPVGSTRGMIGEAAAIAAYAGRERLLIANLSASIASPESTVAAVDLARFLVREGLLGGDWEFVTVDADDPDSVAGARAPQVEDDKWIDLGAPVLWLYSIRTPAGLPEGCCGLLIAPENRHRLMAPVEAGSARPGDGIPADELLRVLDVVEERCVLGDGLAPATDEDCRRLADGTGLSTPASRMLLRGIRMTEEIDASVRSSLGLTTTETYLARNQLAGLDRYVLEEMLIASVPKGEPAGRITEGPDIDAMIDAWNRRYRPAPALTDDEWKAVQSVPHANHGATVTLTTALLFNRIDRPAPRVLAEKLPYPGSALGAVLAVTAAAPLNDARRPAFAAALKRLSDYFDTWLKEFPWTSGVDESVPIDSSVGPRSTEERHFYGMQSIRLFREGFLDELMTDLEIVYQDLPGCPLDPRNSVQNLVENAASILGVSESAATYYLQLLALITPTDAHVRAWNGWKKKDIDAAAAELVAAGLVIEAKRTGAGRTRFISGGWIPGHGGTAASAPCESWSLPLYLTWKGTTTEPVIPGCPPHVPVRDLFRTAWQRILDGDTPGYETLATTRHRKTGK
jgi:hypothetical protein